MENKVLNEEGYREALVKYAQNFTARRRKTSGESLLAKKENLYVIYARKSTEDDKRQVQSIDDQIKACLHHAKVHNLKIVSTPIREEKSAKVAGKRDKFNEMLLTIKQGGTYNAILAWHPDRLARNMKEAGEILDLLDNDVISDLQFPSYTFNNDAAGKMTLSILFAMAKEFSDKLSEDTIRGTRSRVLAGKYVGTQKRGYYASKDEHFRRDDETYNLYKTAWHMYLEGKSQVEIAKWLTENGEEMNDSAMSLYFQDPFPAGIYCYGDEVVDLTKVDSKFQPMVSAQDFLTLQRRARQPSTWSKNTEYRPFNDLVRCSDCGNYMRPAINEGKLYRYLNLVCTSSNCKTNRKERGTKPLVNAVRGAVIVDLAITVVKDMLNIDKVTYEKAKQHYVDNTESAIVKMQEERQNLARQKGILEAKAKKYSKILGEEIDKSVVKRIADDLAVVLKQVRTLDKQILLYDNQKLEVETNSILDFPVYEDFLNFFKDIVKVVQSATDLMLVDQLVKLVFLNIYVADKKVEKYELRAPFKEYNSLKIPFGVADGI